MKILGLNPLGLVIILYLAALVAIGRCYARVGMIASITRGEPLQSVFGIAVFATWIYCYSFVLFYCFRENRYFGLIYSEHISFSTAAIYYALMFGGLILLHILYSAEINAAVDAEAERRRAMDEETRQWLKRQSEVRGAEKEAGEIIENEELASCYELAGLSIKTDRADLARARWYWERKFGIFLTGNAGPDREEERKKIKEIRAALDKITKLLPSNPQ